MATWQVTGLGSDHTQDPQVSLRDYFSSQWSLTGDLTAAKIKMTTGWYDKQAQYQIHFRHDMPAIVKRVTLGGASAIRKYNDFCHVHVFASTLTDNSEPAELGQIYRELERIAGIGITALSATQGFSYFEFDRPMRTLPKEGDNQQSIWHGIGTIGILYHKSYV